MRTIISSALLLAGCSTVSPGVDVRVIEKAVPVVTPCVDAKDIPKLPERVGDRLTGEAAGDTVILAAALIRTRAVAAAAIDMLGRCAK